MSWSLPTPPPVVFLQIHLTIGVFFSPYSTLVNSLGPSGSRLQSLPTGLLWAQSLEVSDMSAAEPPARPRGNLSRPDWCAEAPGPAIVLQGVGLWCEALALCCRATSGSRLSLGVWALKWHKSSGTALSGISVQLHWKKLIQETSDITATQIGTHSDSLSVRACVCERVRALHTHAKDNSKRCISRGCHVFVVIMSCFSASVLTELFAHALEKSHYSSLWCQTRHDKLRAGV